MVQWSTHDHEADVEEACPAIHLRGAALDGMKNSVNERAPLTENVQQS